MDLIDALSLQFKFPTYVIEVGVFTGQKDRKKVELGITNAELMYIHENGSPLHNIPARPVLDMTIAWARSSGLVNKTINEAMEVYLQTEDLNKVDKVMEKMCLKLQNYARHIIYDNDGKLAPNSPSTIRRKGDNHPLFDTGQLARSITCRAIRIKGGNQT